MGGFQRHQVKKIAPKRRESSTEGMWKRGNTGLPLKHKESRENDADGAWLLSTGGVEWAIANVQIKYGQNPLTIVLGAGKHQTAVWRLRRGDS